MFSTTYIVLILISSVLTVMLCTKFHLRRIGLLVALNVLLPFTGLLYAAYVVHVVLPREVAKATGMENPPSPLVPYVLEMRDLIVQRAKEVYTFIRSLTGTPPKA